MGFDPQEKLKTVPQTPGVYFHKDESGKTIYIGKAVNLRNRLKSYFQGRGRSDKPTGGNIQERYSYYASQRLEELAYTIADFDYVQTDTEQEALLLESTLVKRHQPRFNIRLKDDKSYPYIKVDLSDDFPRIYITRNRRDPNAHYFGPFASAGSVNRTLKMLKKLFPYRSCTKKITGNDERPCLEYHIKRCVAPCTGYASKEQYGQIIDQVVNFLKRGPQSVIKPLERDMRKHAKEFNFEEAAVIRDRINDFNSLHERQHVMALKNSDIDVIAAANKADKAFVEIFFIRSGNLMGSDRFRMDCADEADEREALTAFVKQFYASKSEIPRTIACSVAIDEAELISTSLEQQVKHKVRIFSPQRGELRRLTQMAHRNARHFMEREKLRDLSQKGLNEGTLTELQEALNLPHPPRRIECYDISHIQGVDAVASMVVFKDGEPNNAHYRHFKINLGLDQNDDFKSIFEAVSRRLAWLSEDDSRGKKRRDASFTKRPDLMLIDGGKGQLNAALEAKLNSGVEAISFAAIAKKEELIFVPEEAGAIQLDRDSKTLYLVQRIRDEAHRFAVEYHRKLHSKRMSQSQLDGIDGIGPRRKKELLKRFGSVANILAAGVSEIAETPTMNATLAQRLVESL